MKLILVQCTCSNNECILVLTNACMHTHMALHVSIHKTCIHTVPSVITAHPQAVVNATEWTEVILTCSASGTPTPMIRWEREGGMLLPVGAVPSSPESMSGNMVRKTSLGYILFP